MKSRCWITPDWPGRIYCRSVRPCSRVSGVFENVDSHQELWGEGVTRSDTRDWKWFHSNIFDEEIELLWWVTEQKFWNFWRASFNRIYNFWAQDNQIISTSKTRHFGWKSPINLVMNLQATIANHGLHGCTTTIANHGLHGCTTTIS